MQVGVPKEIKVQEHRVGLTPEAVAAYVSRGHKVIVETQAGLGIGATDEHYRSAGAEISDTAAEVFEVSDMIVKVKEPQPAEWAMLREGQILYTYLHLAPDRPQTDGLIASGCTAIAYETVTDAVGGLPLLAPMSEVAGRLSAQATAWSLERHNGGRGLLMGGVPGVAPAQVSIIGGGVVGTNAARIALGMGAEVTILDRSLARLKQLDEMFDGRIRTLYATNHSTENAVLESDAVVGAVLIPGKAAPKLVTRDMLSRMRSGAVLVDVAIDQGGCFETSRATTHADPTYEVDGIVHYCVANMPGAVPRTSSYALGNATLSHGLALADQGLEALADPHLRAGLNVHRGQITNAAVGESLDLPSIDPERAIAA
ncbi:alanine dehydrogenase [Gymnodinialimonas sp. 2305UL16-5]|uniref:alanine dehydrogenase n=1 Tax=Gymnodinialimonas mytili TaxID=3126503 RepID=UPI0030A79EAE